MNTEQAFHYFKGYDDFWGARYNLPENEEAKEYYLRGYRDAEFDVAIGNY